jgi:hypothetical protein
MDTELELGMDEKVTIDECNQEVRLMARRTALLHYYFSKVIVDKLGHKEGVELIKEAIRAYGNHCGEAVRIGVKKMGLPISDENFGKVRDLPKYGWDLDKIAVESGDERLVATYCPLAATFRELGPDGVTLGRLYCFVDQAKYHAYDPSKEFIHAQNVLDGDPYCEFLIQSSEDGES